MRIAIVAAGAAGMYCGSCLRDNALAVAFQRLGHDVTFVPTYTPLRLDEEGVHHEPVFLNGVQVYLEDKIRAVRKPGGRLRRFLGSRRILRWVCGLAIDHEPKKLGHLTVSMLQGEKGNLSTSVRELIEWFKGQERFDVVHLSHSLLSGIAPSLKSELRVPVTCGLSGEDFFLQSLSDRYRSQAMEVLHNNAASVDCFIAPTEYYATHMSKWGGLARDKMSVVFPGISTSDYKTLEEASDRKADGPALTIGFLARIAPEKGPHILGDAFQRLAATGKYPHLRLHIAGYMAGHGVRYAAAIRRRLAAFGLTDRVKVLGTLDRQQKIDFFREIDIFCMPSTHPESKGLPVLEALASGVPVVVPDAGSLPELVEMTGGGLLHQSGDPDDLAEQLAALIDDEPKRRELGERGRATVLERFSAMRMAEDTVAVFESLVSGDAKLAEFGGSA